MNLFFSTKNASESSTTGTKLLDPTSGTNLLDLHGSYLLVLDFAKRLICQCIWKVNIYFHDSFTRRKLGMTLDHTIVFSAQFSRNLINLRTCYEICISATKSSKIKYQQNLMQSENMSLNVVYVQEAHEIKLYKYRLERFWIHHFQFKVTSGVSNFLLLLLD